MSEPFETIPPDPVLEGYIEDADRAVTAINDASPIVRIARVPGGGAPPFLYRGTLAGIEHFVRVADGTFRKCTNPLPFEIVIEHDFCRSLDPLLQLRVVRTSPLLVHPNVSGGICCLGPKFRPATKLRSIVIQFFGIASSRICATADPFDREAADFYLSHRSEILALRAPPLWHRAVAREIRVVDGSDSPGTEVQP